MSTPVDLTDLTGHIQTLQDIKAKQAELTELREQLEQTIKDRLGDAEIGTVDGITVVTWKHTKRTALSQRLLKKLHPKVAAECMETNEIRRFDVIG